MCAVAGINFISMIDAGTCLTTHLTFSIEGGQASCCLADICLIHSHGVAFNL